MPRLFSAFALPPETVESLLYFRGGFFGARWIEREDFHITLRFFGDIDASLARHLAEALDETVFFAPPALELDELGVFGGKTPRALYVRVKPNPELTRLQAAHEKIARRLGLPPETRKFTPHVTLARLRGASPETAAAWLGERAFPLGQTVSPDGFGLYSSRESTGGGPYRLEEFYPFAAQAVSTTPIKGSER